MPATLELCNLDIGAAGRTLVRGLTLQLAAGDFLCVLGTNGAGKTLTLHTLAGLRATSGTVRLGGAALGQLPRRETARRVGLLPQIHEDAFPLSVIDTALAGGYARRPLWQWGGDDDRDRCRDALQRCDLAGLEQRNVTTLSGGERERLALATLMVQDPAVWLLDEPLNHLDPHHQIAVMQELTRAAAATRTVVCTLHDPSLAARHASHALLLYGNGDWEFGAAAELLEPQRMERLYRTPFDYYSCAGDNARTLLMPA